MLQASCFCLEPFIAFYRLVPIKYNLRCSDNVVDYNYFYFPVALFNVLLRSGGENYEELLAITISDMGTVIDVAIFRSEN